MGQSHLGGARTRVVIAWVCAAIVTVTGVANATLIEPKKVIAGPGEQYLPFSDGRWIAYAEIPDGKPNTWYAYAQKIGSGGRVRLTAAGTKGSPGGFDPGTDRIIFNQLSKSDRGIFIFDLSTRERWKVPGVNTKWNEQSPRISSSYILFQRFVHRSGRWYEDLLLYDRATTKTTRLGSWRDYQRYLVPGGVGDRYATWTLCGLQDGEIGYCDAYVYDTVSKTTKVVPANGSRSRYAPVVDEANGHLYYVASGEGCGKFVKFLSVPLTALRSDPRKQAVLPWGVDAGWTMSLTPNADGTSLDLLFERWLCAQQTGDVYALRKVAAIP